MKSWIVRKTSQGWVDHAGPFNTTEAALTALQRCRTTTPNIRFEAFRAENAMGACLAAARYAAISVPILGTVGKEGKVTWKKRP